MAVGGALGLIWSLVTPRHFAWQAWHKLKSTVVLRGRRGTNPHLPSFCVAGVALMAVGGALGLIWSPVTPRHFAWQAWHKLTSTIVFRGRRGTNLHLPSFTYNFVTRHLSHITSTGTVVLCNRRGTDGTGWRAWSDLVARDAAALCVAGVAQTHIYSRFCVAGVAQTHI